MGANVLHVLLGHIIYYQTRFIEETSPWLRVVSLVLGDNIGTARGVASLLDWWNFQQIVGIVECLRQFLPSVVRYAACYTKKAGSTRGRDPLKKLRRGPFG
mmetsp:Transcript_6842/g.16847  ORF Transcript_6842/g.16847 Transcript_6842/m.16847 type:complete len:101 (-) Transcript_6842:93-395(-)